jgi:hypothetical protein
MDSKEEEMRKLLQEAALIEKLTNQPLEERNDIVKFLFEVDTAELIGDDIVIWKN